MITKVKDKVMKYYLLVTQLRCLLALIMVALCNRADHNIFIL